MCGIAGLIAVDGSSLFERDLSSLLAASDSFRHRGPDDDGFHLANSKQAAFAHRRLSIIDPTPEGHQPMLGAHGSMLVFNGEIYNYKELITEFRLSVPASDTAVLSMLLDLKEFPSCPSCVDFFLSPGGMITIKS